MVTHQHVATYPSMPFKITLSNSTGLYVLELLALPSGHDVELTAFVTNQARVVATSPRYETQTGAQPCPDGPPPEASTELVKERACGKQCQRGVCVHSINFSNLSLPPMGNSFTGKLCSGALQCANGRKGGTPYTLSQTPFVNLHHLAA
jgi:hypothetical protein